MAILIKEFKSMENDLIIVFGKIQDGKEVVQIIKFLTLKSFKDFFENESVKAGEEQYYIYIEGLNLYTRECIVNIDDLVHEPTEDELYQQSEDEKDDYTLNQEN